LMMPSKKPRFPEGNRPGSTGRKAEVKGRWLACLRGESSLLDTVIQERSPSSVEGAALEMP
jgi:hypothetical protein